MGSKPFEVCRLGVASTFQIVRPFLKMTCLENTLVGIIGRNERKRDGGSEARRGAGNIAYDRFGPA